MIKMVTTSASLGLSCSATSISSTPRPPIRLTDGQIVSARKATDRSHSRRVALWLRCYQAFVIRSPVMLMTK
jgi:ribosomal protein L16/L10AE